MTMVRVVGRLLAATIEVLLQLSLVVLRPFLDFIEELIGMALRVAVRLLSYPDVWIIIAVAVLWAMTAHGLVATVAAVVAIGAVLLNRVLQMER